MALAGKLKEFGLADIFQLIGMQKKTGVLTLDKKDDTIHVLFDDGKIVYADSKKKDSEDRLGKVLVKRGLITENQLQEALTKQKQTLRRLGHILVNDGYLTRAQMQEALYHQVTTILYRLFRWKDGEFNFNQEETLEYDSEFFVPIPPENVLMEGVQMMDEWPIIEKKIRSMDMVFAKAEMGEGRVQLKEESEDEFEDSFDWGEDGDTAEPLGTDTDPGADQNVIQLSPSEWSVYQAVDGDSTVQELCYRTSQSEFATCRTLYDLLSRNLIVEVRADVAGKEEAVVATPAKDSHVLVSGLGYLILVVALLLSAATFWMNPYSPLARIAKPGAPAAPIGKDVSKLRLERIHYALRVYNLQHGDLPQELQQLVEGNYLKVASLSDPWGQPYIYKVEENEYTLTGLDAEGQLDADLILTGSGGREGSASTSR